MTDTRTYRGRSLEDVLPQIRSELGPDAIVVSRREGLAGGVGGFFQRAFIEVEARGPAHEPGVELRSDRATAEGMQSPGVRALLDQSAPFSDQLAAAERSGAGLYGPQPAVPDVMAILTAKPAAPAERAEPAPAPPHAAAAEPPVAVARQAAALRERLETAGLPARLAAEILDEAVTHGLPFASPRALKTLVRASLARRIAVMGPLASGPRTVVVAGPPACGRSTAAHRLAAAYRAAGTVAVRELCADDLRLAGPFDGLTVVDPPPTGVRDTGAVQALAAALEGAAAEVHVAVPATTSAPATAELLAALAPLRPTHVLLTHADDTACPGGALAAAMTGGPPLSYVSGADALEPADPAAVARRLLP